MPYVARLFYGKEEVSKFIKDRKAVIELHDGYMIEERVKENRMPNYVYTDKYEIIYQMEE